MNYKITIQSLITILFLFASLIIAADDLNEFNDDEATIASGNNKFAFDLYKTLGSETGNVFFSPLSIRTAFAMAYGGAKGTTAEQMAKVLYFPQDQTPFHPQMSSFINELNLSGSKKTFKLSIANAMWPDKGLNILRKFHSLIKDTYKAGIRRLDYSADTEGARKTINAWVERKTKGKIKNIVERDMLSPDVVLVLTNAVYFKGTWLKQFDKDNTENSSFYSTPDNPVDVPFMKIKDEFKYMENDQLQMFELPYTGERLVMTVLLPTLEFSLKQLEESLTTKNLDRWLASMEVAEKIIHMPKFKMTCKYKLKEALTSMGMINAFGPADFSGISKLFIFISDVLHKAFVNVNETGTEATASTVIIFLKAGNEIVKVDRPFIFLIRDTQTGAILFIGRIVDPAK